MHHKLLIAAAATALLAAPTLVSAQKGDQPAPGSKMEQKAQPGGPQNGQPRARTQNSDQPATQTQRDDADQDKQPRGTAQDQQKQQQPPRGTAQDQKSPSAGTKVQLSQDQRSRIHTTIIQARPNRVTNVTFNISVGTRVPRTVRLVALPGPIVEIVPEYRGYLYFVVGDEIVIVDPATMEIVAVIEA